MYIIANILIQLIVTYGIIMLIGIGISMWKHPEVWLSKQVLDINCADIILLPIHFLYVMWRLL